MRAVREPVAFFSEALEIQITNLKHFWSDTYSVSWRAQLSAANIHKKLIIYKWVGGRDVHLQQRGMQKRLIYTRLIRQFP